MRGNDGTYNQGYVGALKEDAIVDKQPLSSKAYDFLQSYKSLQLLGFTEKSMEWSALHYRGYSNEEILRFRDKNFDLSTFPQIADKIVK